MVVGGGQEASAVTTTSAKAGKFESRFFHKVRSRERKLCVTGGPSSHSCCLLPAPAINAHTLHRKLLLRIFADGIFYLHACPKLANSNASSLRPYSLY